jgi:ribosomal protein S12 methylthiotransferase accessory factor
LIGTTRLRSATDAPALKVFREGTHRVTTPEATLDRIRHFMPVMGITRVANITGLDSIGIPVVTVCRPNSRSLSVFQGKGLDLAAAKASGLMEAIETYHAEHITLPLKLASYEELRYTHRVVDVEALPRITTSRFDPNLPLLWLEGYDLLHDEPVWVPHELVHTNYTLPLPPGSGCFTLSSNGLASGNHILESVSHGLCEVVERDATTLWHVLDDEARARTRLDLETVDDPACRLVLGKLEQAGVAVAVWETTTDVGIPSFLCTIVERTDDPGRLLYSTSGMGCHPARPVALLRALTEAAQSRLTLIAGSRDDTIRPRYERSRDPDVLRRQRAGLAVTRPVRDFREVPNRDGPTLEDDVAWELERLRVAGATRVIVVDLTKPEFRLPVVRIIIPGLEGSSQVPGYAFGRRARARARPSP